MSTSNIEILDRRSTALEQSTKTYLERYNAAISPMHELQMQIVRTGDLEKLKQLREIEREWKADQAKQAFNVAFASFKAEAVKLTRTKLVTDGPLKGKKHVELGEVVRVATPSLSKHGLSISWRLSRDDKDWMEVTCTLRHAEGHSESVAMGGAPDVGPGRNAIQARGSTKMYLERYTATAILGLAPEDEDTDGRPPQDEPESCMEEGVAADFLSLIEGSTTVEELQANYFKARDVAEAAHDKKALQAFAQMKNKMYLRLKKGGRS